MEIDKLCRRCGEVKPHGVLGDGVRTQGMCRECAREYGRLHYKDHTHRYRETRQKNSKIEYAQRRAMVIAAKDLPCVDCGIKYPSYVMQFDHLDPNDKSFTISNSLRRVGLKRLLAEMDKCEIVCANCHAERTHKRSNNVVE